MSAPTGMTVPKTACRLTASRVRSLRRGGFAVQAILARQPALIIAAVAGLLAMIGAAASGSSFTAGGREGASMAMTVLAAAGLLCYGAGLYLLSRPVAGSHDG